MPQLKCSLSIGFPGARHEDIIEIDSHEWAECETDEQREKLIDAYATDWAHNYIDVGAQLVEEAP